MPAKEAEIAIIAPTGAEWLGVVAQLSDAKDVEDFPMPAKIGTIGRHRIFCCAVGKGEEEAASATGFLLAHVKPSEVFLVGIAGGFPAQGISRGDVVVAHVIYSFDYGKLVNSIFVRRPELDINCDRELLARAEVVAAQANGQWCRLLPISRPDGQDPEKFKVHVDCYVASSNKVVDDPDHDFYAKVAAYFPEIHAVEMEGIGAGAGARLDRAVGFLMIRGISDQPGSGVGREQRKQWKDYAIATAAAFTRAVIEQLPPRPRRRGRNKKSPPAGAASWTGSAPSEPADNVLPDETLLNHIRVQLGDGRPPWACALWGEAGVGKSTLAEFVGRRLATDSPRRRDLYWIKFQRDQTRDARSITPISALHELARNAGRPLPEDLDKARLAAAVKDILGRRPYLVVCDNVRNEDELKEYDLRSPNGIVLITSLSGEWKDISQIEIKPWDPLVSRDYIRRRLPQAHPDAASESELDSLAHELKYLALGLVQSTSYIRRTNIPIREYLQKLSERAKSIIDEPAATLGLSEKTIQSTCYMLFEDIVLARSIETETWKAALHLLGLMASLDVMGTDYEFLRSVFVSLYDVDGTDRLNSALMCLADLSLVSMSADRSEISLHQLTHIAARCWIDDRYAAGNENIIAIMREIFPAVRKILLNQLIAEPGLKPRAMLLHARSFLSLDAISATECQGPERDELIGALISTLAESFDWPERMEATDYVCGLAARAQDEKNRIFAEAIRGSLRIWHPQASPGLKNSEDLFVRAIEAFKPLCADDADLVNLSFLQRRLADIRFDIGTLEEGLEAVDASLLTLASIRNSRSIDYARCWATRARILAYMGESEQCILAYGVSINTVRAINESSFRKDRDEVEFVYCRADIEVKVGHIRDAIRNLRWSCTRCEEIGYPENDQGSIQNSLGYALLWHGDLEESRKWLEAGRRGIGVSYGLASPAYAKQLLDLSMLAMWEALMRSGNPRVSAAEMEPALRLARDALDISVKADRARRSEFQSRLGLSACLINIGAFEEARGHVSQARSLLEAIEREESRHAALMRLPRLLRSEGAVYAALRQDEQANAVVEGLHDRRSQYAAGDPGEAIRSDCVIAQVQFAVGNAGAAETGALLNDAARRVAGMFGNKNPIALLAEKLADRYANQQLGEWDRRVPLIL